MPAWLTTFISGVLATTADAIAARPMLPAYAAPSPLLTAAGLARPRLTREECGPSRSPLPMTLRVRWRQALAGVPWVCHFEARSGVGSALAFTTVSMDARGHVFSVSRIHAGLTVAAAAQATDSVLAAGRRARGARPFRCVVPSPLAPAGAAPVLWRGWQTDAYTAVVVSEPSLAGRPRSASWRLDVYARLAGACPQPAPVARGV
jgi:hypothetical protein